MSRNRLLNLFSFDLKAHSLDLLRVFVSSSSSYGIALVPHRIVTCRGVKVQDSADKVKVFGDSFVKNLSQVNITCAEFH